jgi:acylphosphatase
VQWTRVRARVVGQVQGVSFHEAAVANATSLGLSGWVRTEADGTISLEIEGVETKVDALVDWCRQGPPGARVDNVVVLQCTPSYERTPFIIKD